VDELKGFYLINGIGSGFIVILGDLQAVQHTPISPDGANLNRITRGKERGPPIVNKPFINNDKSFNIIEFLAIRVSMQGNEVLLVPGESREVGVQYSNPPHLQ
jgi:hypothetical protein